MDNKADVIDCTMSADFYHSLPAIGSSGLKKFQQSPLHYWSAFLDPDRVPVDNLHFRIGRAWHCAVFEPQEFARRFVAGHDAHASTKRAVLLQRLLAGEVVPDQLRELPEGLSATSKEGKALAAELEADGKIPVAAEDYAFACEWLPKLAGRDVLSADRIEGVMTMARIARALPISRVVFERFAGVGAAETSLFCDYAASGVRLKIRPDYMLKPCDAFPHGLIIDGKSTTDASEEGFGRQVWNLDYGLQAALYTRVYQQVIGTRERPAFLWLAQEKDAPHAARYYAAGADLIAHWDAKIDALLPRVAECQRTGTWPGYPETVSTLALPAWAQKQLDGLTA